MLNVDLCRVCLVSNTKMHHIANTSYQEIFEKLATKLCTADGRPETVCWLCLSALRRARRLADTARAAHEVLTQLSVSGIQLSEDTVSELDRKFVQKLTRTPIQTQSIKERYEDTTIQVETKQEPSENDQIDFELCEETQILDQTQVETNNTQVVLTLTHSDSDIEQENFTEFQLSNTGEQEHMACQTIFSTKEEQNSYGESIVQICSENNISDIQSGTNQLTDVENSIGKGEEFRKMAFKIVQTNEEGKPKLTVVPTLWETKGILHLPPKNLKFAKKLIMDKNSRPGPDWQKFKCVLKRNYIPTYEEANKELCQMKQTTDIEYVTDDFDVLQASRNDRSPINDDVMEFEAMPHNLSEDGLLMQRFEIKEEIKEEIEETSTEFEVAFTPRLEETPKSKTKKPKQSYETLVRAWDGQARVRHACPQCEKTYVHRYHLLRHLRMHNEGAENLKRKFSCETCGKAFYTKSTLKKHRMYHSEVKKYCCDHCPTKCTQKIDMERHMNIHTGKKPYQCDICKQKFNRKSNMLLHILTHSDNKPFPCQICQMTFSRKYDLNRHIKRKHTREKPYACDICEFRSVNASYLKTHVANMHLKLKGEKPYGCSVCGLKVASENSLKLHIKKKHFGVNEKIKKTKQF